MAKRSIARKRRKRNVKKWVSTTQAPLCALGEVLRVRKVFDPFHDKAGFIAQQVLLLLFEFAHNLFSSLCMTYVDSYISSEDYCIDYAEITILHIKYFGKLFGMNIASTSS